MLDKNVFAKVVADQRHDLEQAHARIPRESLALLRPFTVPTAMIVMGVRRCGKSTLLAQFMKQHYDDDFWYVNFDQDQLSNFQVNDFQPMLESLIESFGKKSAIYLDEIQTIKGWELFVNRIMREGYKVYITGSNADLLSKELGTHMTGRHVDFELYPFSFSEFLTAKKYSGPRKKVYGTEERVQLLVWFKSYLLLGGMPEAVIENNAQFSASVVTDVVQKDIIRRYNLRKSNELQTVVRFLLNNVGNETSFRSLSNQHKISNVTVQKYLKYLEEAYLVFTVNRFERKIKQFDKNPKKVYAIDNGISGILSTNLNENNGRLLENLVAIELKRRKNPFFYYVNKNKTKTDFVVTQNNQVVQAVQVCFDPTNLETLKREEKALIATMNELNLKDGLILTMETDEEKKMEDKTIHCIPTWQWLLEPVNHQEDKS